MMLHTFNSSDAYRMHGHRASAEDLILLIEDGVFITTQQDLTEDKRIRVLREDLAQRGLPEPSAITCITYSDWVHLTVESQHCLSWTR
jgi:sulfur relay protein TusB/DsrH